MSSPGSCRFCSAPLPEGRPYDHCTADVCVQRWMAERRATMTIVLLPKQNFEMQYVEQVRGQSGKSSGR